MYKSVGYVPIKPYCSMSERAGGHTRERSHAGAARPLRTETCAVRCALFDAPGMRRTCVVCMVVYSMVRVMLLHEE